MAPKRNGPRILHIERIQACRRGGIGAIQATVISELDNLLILHYTKERPLMYGRNNGASQSVTLHVGRYGWFDIAKAGKFHKSSFLLRVPLWHWVFPAVIPVKAISGSDRPPCRSSGAPDPIRGPDSVGRASCPSNRQAGSLSHQYRPDS
jgi:hypothetical protein